MHGREGDENRKLSWHMLSVPSTTTVAGGVSDSNGSSSSCFVKDGRKINVGDCALFKPAKDSPPFVGLIRSWTSEKESNLKLRVNWLYRPAEVKLLKGAALEAAPNEVFYSFHSDEIPAASLLHPCKVAFLPKGVELPPGISSFVCRRVYDITNKCLWWLTDQDYIDDRQQEVDQLLHRTRIEMHASVEQQQDPRSPKPVNGSAATSPLKHSPDSVQNSSSNLSSHRKGKKRERGDQSFDAVKRERSTRPDDGHSSLLRSESMLNLEIAKLTERGGLVDSEAVVRLVRLMQPEKSEKKIDLTGRSMLAGIIAATEKLDCLNQFVQLRGLHVLNEWLQEIHKGKIGDSGNLKNSDRSVDDFLLVLLRALDRLPVNLNALQMCNIGKSVNHLRSHKNSEIQKKARSLVDTWKKRVEAEMSVNEVKPGSGQAVPWPGKSQHDSSHGGNRHPSESDAAVRSTVTHHTSLKSAPVKPVPGESNPKSASAHPGAGRSALSPTSATDNYKDGQSRITANGGGSEPQTVAREDKSSSSSQSHTNSQCSSDQGKYMVPCGKEDTRRSTAGSVSLNKTVASSTKHHKSANGPTSGAHREPASNKSSSMPRNSVVEKVSHNAIDASGQESNNHKLIVKIPNRGRGSGQNNTVGCMEDSPCRNSRASSPVLPEKHDQADVFVRGNKLDSHQSPVVDVTSTSVHQRTSDARRSPNISKIASSPSRNEIKSRKTYDSSFSSMNALIESCAKFSEATASVSAGDDVGMNLLASVAAREISKSDNVSPAVSPHRNSKKVEKSCSNHVGNEKQLHVEDVVQQGQSTNVADTENHINIAGLSKVDGESNELSVMTENLHQSVEGCLKTNGTLDEKFGTACPPVSVACNEGRIVGDLHAESVTGELIASKEEIQNELLVANQGSGGSLEAEDKVKAASLDVEFEKKVHRDIALCPATNDDDRKSNVGQGLQSNIALEQNALAVAVQSDPVNKIEKPLMVSSGKSHQSAAVISTEVKTQKLESVASCDLARQAGNGLLKKETDPSSASVKQGEPVVCSADVDPDRICKDQNLENTDALTQQSGSSASQISSAVAVPEAELHSSSEVTKSTAVEEKSQENSGFVTENVAQPPASGCPNVDAQLGFDLNEGFNGDEGKNDEPINLADRPCPEIVCSVSPFSVSSTSCGLPASVTVAAAAKGPFVPHDDLLWNKQELGWKGSAATSAFRPAEPRKLMEGPLGTSKAPLLDAPASRPARFLLDIDLNVADESCVQEFNARNNPVCELMSTSLRSSGGLDLDLNKVDEAPDLAHVGRYMNSNIQRAEVSTQHVKPSTSNVFSTGAASGKRDFDLNNGPATEEIPFEQIPSSQHNRVNIPLQTPLGPRINSSDTGNCFSWYPPGNSYSVSVTPSALPDREAFSIVGIGGGPQRVVGGPASALAFNPDAYRGSVLSSSPALPFHASPFQYPVLPFGTSFPLPTSALGAGSSGYMDPTGGGRISAIPSQLVGNAAGVSFQYPQAYVVSRAIPDASNNNVIESNHKWGKQGLDLNSGPGVLDMEVRDESLPIVSRQVSTMNSQSLAEEQARMYSMGGHVKRKEPDGGWNIDKLNFKQSSWR
ncbi:hypothetical protein BVRB_5g116490 [Beta vulgaris subsp. vulgaris]|nr:hypothetical protein BVRB_5g116490 [Beta vulgaris subsp. vulgaris]